MIIYDPLDRDIVELPEDEEPIVISTKHDKFLEIIKNT